MVIRKTTGETQLVVSPGVKRKLFICAVLSRSMVYEKARAMSFADSFPAWTTDSACDIQVSMA